MKAINLLLSASVMALVAGLAGCVTDEVEQREDISEHGAAISQPSIAAPHCVAAATAQTIDGKAAFVDKSERAQVRCFATFSDAIYAATDSRVRLAPSVTADTVDERTLNGPDKSTNASFVIGIENVDAGFQGASFTITSSVTCAGFNITFSFANIAGWNDVITSARAFSNCNNAVHFEHVFSGASINCGTACANIGDAMNDRTTSVRWSQ